MCEPMISKMKKPKFVPILIMGTAPLFIVFTIALSILYGTKDIDVTTIWMAITQFDSGNVDHNIIMQSRLPRVLAALLVGAFLAISGAIMQGMTRNYLASPLLWG